MMAFFLIGGRKFPLFLLQLSPKTLKMAQKVILAQVHRSFGC